MLRGQHGVSDTYALRSGRHLQVLNVHTNFPQFRPNLASEMFTQRKQMRMNRKPAEDEVILKAKEATHATGGTREEVDKTISYV